MSRIARVAVAAALLAGCGLATSAQAAPPTGSCHIYQKPPIVTHSIPGVPQVPGTPYVYCDY